MTAWAPKELQKAIYAILSADVSLQTALGGTPTDTRVYDFVPDNKSYPYVTLDMGVFNDRGNHTKEGWATNFQVNVWARPNVRGAKPVQDIQAIIHGLLHEIDVDVLDWNIIVLRCSSVTIITDDDNITKHGIQIFKLMLGEA
jgi:hypothetical protein